jgi:IS66 C-terminal element
MSDLPDQLPTDPAELRSFAAPLLGRCAGLERLLKLANDARFGRNAKNAVFAGCDEGAENWALPASLIETCKLNGVGAELWLADVLAKLVNGWPAARLDELLPWALMYTMHVSAPRLAA